MPLIAALLAASLAFSELTPPTDKPGGGAGAAETPLTNKQKLSELYRLVDSFHAKNTGFGPVAVYEVWEQPVLPPRIVIVRQSSIKDLIYRTLKAVLGDKTMEKFWVVDMDEAAKNIAKKLKIEKAEARRKLDEEMGHSVVIVYKCHAGPEGEDEEEGAVIGLAEEDAAPPPAPKPAPAPPAPSKLQ